MEGAVHMINNINGMEGEALCTADSINGRITTTLTANRGEPVTFIRTHGESEAKPG